MKPSDHVLFQLIKNKLGESPSHETRTIPNCNIQVGSFPEHLKFSLATRVSYLVGGFDPFIYSAKFLDFIDFVRLQFIATVMRVFHFLWMFLGWMEAANNAGCRRALPSCLIHDRAGGLTDSLTDCVCYFVLRKYQKQYQLEKEGLEQPFLRWQDGVPQDLKILGVRIWWTVAKAHIPSCIADDEDDDAWHQS